MKTASITAWWQNIRTLVCGLYIIDRSGSSELETSRTLPVKHDSTGQDQFFSSWKLLSIVNILLVASAGVLLRAKILFPIPWLHHKFLLHAHSHFAFSGWLGQLLSVLIIQLLIRSVEIDLKKIRILFILNAIASYGMLFTFPFMGYAGPSIFFSTISMLYSIVFPIVTLTYINRSNLSSLTKNCFRLSLGSQIISAAGPIALGLSMIQKIQSTNIEVKAVYWFLHFQYNGFFFFAICGLFCSSLSNYWQKSKYLQIAFILFAFSLVPAYLLSIQWLNLSRPMQTLASISGLMQLLGLFYVIRYLLLNKVRRSEWLWVLAFIGFALKVIFQFFSIFPSIGKIAFGFRPIVIGYLHLVLLGFMTIFLFGYMKRAGEEWNRRTNVGIVFFATGIVINELALFFQGSLGIMGIYLPVINEALLVIAVCMLVGVIIILSGYRPNKAI